MAKRMKRTLSLLLTAVLLLGMLPITAAAAAESSNQQIEGGNVPVYYTPIMKVREHLRRTRTQPMQ